MVADRPKGGINLYIKFEKHKFDQIHVAVINIKVFREKCIPLSWQSYDVSGEKHTRTNNMISVIRIYLVLSNSFNQSEPGVTIYQARKTIQGKFHIHSLESKYSET